MATARSKALNMSHSEVGRKFIKKTTGVSLDEKVDPQKYEAHKKEALQKYWKKHNIK